MRPGMPDYYREALLGLVVGTASTVVALLVSSNRRRRILACALTSCVLGTAYAAAIMNRGLAVHQVLISLSLIAVLWAATGFLAAWSAEAVTMFYHRSATLDRIRE